ncbi:MAG TPA: c-type cytochrome, partial [Bryobacteraceae bacterium]|nr:c-type cytochrome [Bryobacteraceae bacterium]
TSALQPHLAKLLRESPDAVRIAMADAVGNLTLSDAAPALLESVADTKLNSDVRVAALDALAALKDTRLGDALNLARSDKVEALRRAASRLAGTTGSGGGAASLTAALEGGSVGEKQTAVQALGVMKGKEADDALAKLLDQLLAGKVAKELTFDVIDAASKKSATKIKDRLAKYVASLDPKDDLAKWRDTLYGGDAKAGRQIFYERAEAGCFRCHKVNGEGGDVGPDLTGIINRQPREYLLESMVYPNKKIAPGFESVLVVLKNGEPHTGILKSETADALVVNSPEDGLLKVPKANIARRDKSLSPMPEGLGDILSKRDLRDVIEFLSTSK